MKISYELSFLTSDRMPRLDNKIGQQFMLSYLNSEPNPSYIFRYRPFGLLDSRHTKKVILADQGEKNTGINPPNASEKGDTLLRDAIDINETDYGISEDNKKNAKEMFDQLAELEHDSNTYLFNFLKYGYRSDITGAYIYKEDQLGIARIAGTLFGYILNEIYDIGIHKEKDFLKENGILNFDKIQQISESVKGYTREPELKSLHETINQILDEFHLYGSYRRELEQRAIRWVDMKIAARDLESIRAIDLSSHHTISEATENKGLIVAGLGDLYFADMYSKISLMIPPYSLSEVSIEANQSMDQNLLLIGDIHSSIGYISNELSLSMINDKNAKTDNPFSKLDIQLNEGRYEDQELYLTPHKKEANTISDSKIRSIINEIQSAWWDHFIRFNPSYDIRESTYVHPEIRFIKNHSSRISEIINDTVFFDFTYIDAIEDRYDNKMDLTKRESETIKDEYLFEFISGYDSTYDHPLVILDRLLKESYISQRIIEANNVPKSSFISKKDLNIDKIGRNSGVNIDNIYIDKRGRNSEIIADFTYLDEINKEVRDIRELHKNEHPVLVDLLTRESDIVHRIHRMDAFEKEGAVPYSFIQLDSHEVIGYISLDQLLLDMQEKSGLSLHEYLSGAEERESEGSYIDGILFDDTHHDAFFDTGLSIADNYKDSGVNTQIGLAESIKDQEGITNDLKIGDYYSRLGISNEIMGRDTQADREKERDAYIEHRPLLIGDQSDWDDIWNRYSAGVDVLDPPDSDFDYTKLANQVHNENGVPYRPLSPTNVPDVKVDTPLHHPLPEHFGVGVDDSKIIAVDNSVIIEVILAIESLKFRNKLRYAGMPAEKTLREVFSKLYVWIREGFPDHPEFERMYRFARWYGEHVLVKSCKHILYREYSSFRSTLHQYQDLGVPYFSDHWVYRPAQGTLVTTSSFSTLGFRLENFIDGKVIIRGYFDNPLNQGTMKVIVDGEQMSELPMSHNGSFELNFDMEQGDHEYEFEFSGDSGTVSLSSMEVTGCIFERAWTESDESDSNGLKLTQQLIDLLLHYYDIHHYGGKVKGTMQVRQRKVWNTQ